MTTTASAITVAYTVVVVIGSLLALVVWSSMRRRPAVVEGASAGCGGCHTFASAGSTGAVAPPPPDVDRRRPDVDDHASPGREPPPFPAGGLDALPPVEVARNAETVGVAKARMASLDDFVLAVLAGAFIALGAIFATTVSAGGGELPFGVLRLLAGVTSCSG